MKGNGEEAGIAEETTISQACQPRPTLRRSLELFVFQDVLGGARVVRPLTSTSQTLDVAAQGRARPQAWQLCTQGGPWRNWGLRQPADLTHHSEATGASSKEGPVATPVGITTAPISLSFFFIVSLLLFSLLLRIFGTEHIKGSWHSPSRQWVYT